MGRSEEIREPMGLVHPGRYGAWLVAVALGLTIALLLGWHVLPWLRALWAPSGAGGGVDGLALLGAPLLALTAFAVGWSARARIAASRRPWRLALGLTLAGGYVFALLVLAAGSLAVLVEGAEDRLLAGAVLVFSWAFAVPYGLLGWALFLPLALPLTAAALVVLKRAAGGLTAAEPVLDRARPHAPAAGAA